MRNVGNHNLGNNNFDFIVIDIDVYIVNIFKVSGEITGCAVAPALL